MPLFDQAAGAIEIDAALISVQLSQTIDFRFSIGLRGQDFYDGDRVRWVRLVKGRVYPHNRIDMFKL